MSSDDSKQPSTPNNNSDFIDYLRQSSSPINHARRTLAARRSQSSEDVRRLDSDDIANLPLPNLTLPPETSTVAVASSTTTTPQQQPPHSGRQSFRPQSTGHEPEPPPRERPSQGEAWPYRETLSFTRSLVFYGAGSISKEHEVACRSISKCRGFRVHYQGGKGTMVPRPDLLGDYDKIRFCIGQEGTAELYHADHPDMNLIQVPNVEAFHQDYQTMVTLCSQGAMRSFCFQRLQMLSTSFKMHTISNATIERKEQSQLLGTDFYRTMKVDNHIHAAAAPSAKQFVEFVRSKLEQEPDTVVVTKQTTNEQGETIEMKKTLQQVYDEAGLELDHLTIDAFNVLADYSVYQRFDNFNSKYSPFELADFRRIFLKTNNAIGGRYFAELLKMVLNRHETNKGHNSCCEMRLSIYGMESHEWYDLSKWMLTDWSYSDFEGNMISQDNRWIIQIPRLWRIYSTKPVPSGQEPRSFVEMIHNLFVPLFKATLDPDRHPEISEAMKHIVGFDSVDDEGATEANCGTCPRPRQWTTDQTPAYWWQLYYIWSNLQVLNRLRHARNLNTFAFRPHAGETGDWEHLVASYMLCESINHGVLLDAQVSLQYLYYLDQVGMSLSPLSNNFLFVRIADNPFKKFFYRGLNVTLSTDDPLLFHLSDDALLEEYSVARATFDLSMTDMMEIARNSVLQCGFGHEFKQQWLGKDYQRGMTFCDDALTHVPLIRAKFRAEHLALEHMMVQLIGAGKGDKVLEEMKVQFGLARDAHRDVLFENFDHVPNFPERGQL